MKRILVFAAMLLSFEALAQSPMAGILNRFTDPDKGHVVFIEKGSRAMGIGGSYRNISTDGYTDGDGYTIISLLNVGDGRLQTWNVTPSASWFVADDISLGVNLTYNGYAADTDIRLDFRDILPNLYDYPEIFGEGASAANVTLTARHMIHHAWGAAFAARKYMSFFGSKTFGIFGEGRVFVKYGNTYSNPRNKEYGKTRFSQSGQAGLQIAGGLAVRLRDNSAITISVPIIGVAWNGSWQDQTRTYKTPQRDENGNKVRDADGNILYETATVQGGGKMTSIKASRATDVLGIQFGYVHYIQPKKK